MVHSQNKRQRQRPDFGVKDDLRQQDASQGHHRHHRAHQCQELTPKLWPRRERQEGRLGPEFFQ